MHGSCKAIGGLLLAVCGGLLLASLPLFPASTARAANTDWSEIKPDGALELRDIGALDAATAWAVGSNESGDGIILKTSDGGAGWEVQASFEGQQLFSVAAVDYYAAYASGSGGLYRTFDGGETWETVYVSSSGTEVVYEVSAPDVSHIWALMVDTAGTSFILRSNDGGATWVNVYNRPETSGRLESVAAVDEFTAWAVGGSASSSVILKTGDKGVTWQEQTAPVAAPLLLDVSATDASTAWAVGGVDDSGTVLHTTDGGANWSKALSGATDSFCEVEPVNRSIVWVAGNDSDSSQSIIMKTVDTGSTWDVQYASTGGLLYAISGPDPTLAWAAGGDQVDPTVLRTVNGGDSRPDIKGVVPDSGQVGEVVTVTGCDFGAVRGTSKVTFGGVEASGYLSWSDGEIQAMVPGGLKGRVTVVVTTAAGTSGNGDFLAAYPVSVTSIDPDSGLEFTLALEIASIKGVGFQPGATVRFEMDNIVLQAYNVNVISESEISCTIGLFVAASGAFDVYVTNPDGGEACLQAGFFIDSPCGAGAGTAALAFGGMVGLLSAGHRLGRRRRRRRGMD